jgi:hypothetical protein
VSRPIVTVTENAVAAHPDGPCGNGIVLTVNRGESVRERLGEVVLCTMEAQLDSLGRGAVVKALQAPPVVRADRPQAKIVSGAFSSRSSLHDPSRHRR